MRPILIALVLAMATPSATADETTTNRAQAKSHYEAGDRAFRLGDFDRAIAEFKSSYDLSGVPLLLYNIAQAYRQKGDAKHALFFYQQFLATGAADPSSKRVAEQRVDELKTTLEQQAKANEAAATAQAKDTGGAQPNTRATSEVRASEAERTAWYKNTTGWGLASAGVVTAAVGAGLIGGAYSEHNEALSAMTMTSFDAHHSNSVRFQQAGWPLLGVGGALVIAGSVVFVVRRRGHR